MKLRQKAYCCQGIAIRNTARFAIAASTLLFSHAVVAQIIPDSTLPVNSNVTPNGNTLTIEGGTRTGGNLFHSFKEFSLPTGGEAFFNNAVDVQNIFSRVTGSNISNIDGLIRANGAANLFLLNPNGIIFGPNARLNINGSFVATTANAIGLTNGDTFYSNAATPLPNQLLNVNPNALLFNQMAAVAIANRSIAGGTGLQVPAGRSLLLVGGDINLEGGRLQTPGGRVELAAVRGTATVGLQVDEGNLRLNVPTGIGLANVSLSNRARIDVSTTTGGSIAINAQNLSLTAGSILLAGITGVGSPDKQAGNIDINVPGTINLNAGGFSNRVAAQAVGNAGNINITTGSLGVTNGGFVSAASFGRGNAGNVNIQAANAVSFDGMDANGNSSLASVALTASAVGNAGNVNITANSLSVKNGAFLSVATLGQGNGGNLNINADAVSFDGVGSNRRSTFAAAAVDPTAVGNAGTINITADSLSVTNGAYLSSATLGKGNGGTVNINADAVSFDGVGTNGSESFASTAVNRTAVGNGGIINIDANSLSVTNGAFISSATLGQGNGGIVNINANRVSFDGQGANGGYSFASSAVNSTALGNSGSINITADSLSITDGARLIVSTFGQGSAGSINIQANTVSFDGVASNGRSSGAFSTVEAEGIGNGGDINITAESISLTNSAEITARTLGQGNGGNITINANTLQAFNGGQIVSNSISSGNAGNVIVNVTDSITLSGSDANYFQRLATFGENRVRNGGPASGMYVSAEGTGNAGNLVVTADSIRLEDAGTFKAETRAGSQGNITLNAGNIVLRRGSNITTNASGSSTGGNININTDTLVALENSDITANAVQGRGGNISISTQGIFGTEFRSSITPESDITASSQFGISGTVAITNPEVETSSLLVELPQNLLDPSGQITSGCPADGGNTFTVAGRGGLPEDPTSSLLGRAIWWDGRDLSNRNLSATMPLEKSPKTEPTPEIVEATGWIINQKGQVELVADRNNNSWRSPTNCPRRAKIRGFYR